MYKRGKSLAGKHVVVFVVRNGKNENRVGISASKKIGNAVYRNRARRRIKEAYRLIEPKLDNGYDIAIIPRAAVLEDAFVDIVSGLGNLMRKHNVWKKSAN